MAYLSFENLNQQLRSENFFIVDRRVFDLYRERLPSLEGKNVYLLEDPESEKSYQGLEKVLNFFLQNKITRLNKVVAIGGGATSDLAGFAASVVLRGVEWVCVPTTLLSLVDASIGGKTGINTERGKNLIGSFHSPCRTLICIEFLETLSEDERVSGMGEILKYAFLDNAVFRAAARGAGKEELIDLCRSFKAGIVEKDFRERGERAKLNLGHTFGHVLEKMLGLPHGLAVAMGMELVIKSWAPELYGDFVEMKDKLEVRFELPESLDREMFFRLLESDKKRTGDKITFIVPKRVGDVRIESFGMKEARGKLDEKCPSLFK